MWPVADFILGIHLLTYLAPEPHLAPRPAMRTRGACAGRLGNSEAADPCHPSTRWEETEMKHNRVRRQQGSRRCPCAHVSLIDLPWGAGAGRSARGGTAREAAAAPSVRRKMRVNSPGVASTRNTVLRHTRERKRKRGRPGSREPWPLHPSLRPAPCAWSPQLPPPPVAPVQTCRSPHLLTLAPAKMNSGTEAAAREGKREDARSLAHTESGGPRSRGRAGTARHVRGDALRGFHCKLRVSLSLMQVPGTS